MDEPTRLRVEMHTAGIGFRRAMSDSLDALQSGSAGERREAASRLGRGAAAYTDALRRLLTRLSEAAPTAPLLEEKERVAEYIEMAEREAERMLHRLRGGGGVGTSEG